MCVMEGPLAGDSLLDEAGEDREEFLDDETEFRAVGWCDWLCCRSRLSPLSAEVCLSKFR